MSACATEEQIIASLYTWIGHQAQTAIPHYRPPGWFECDLYLVTKNRYGVEYEVKRTLDDYKKDTWKGARNRSGAVVATRSSKHNLLSRSREHEPWRRIPNRFYFVVPRGLLAKQPVPDWAGVIEFDPRIRNRGPFINVRQCVVPTTTKRAPLLHKERITPERIAEINATLRYRFWNNVQRCGSIVSPTIKEVEHESDRTDDGR